MTARDPKDREAEEASKEQIEADLLRLLGEDAALDAHLMQEDEALLEAISGASCEEPPTEVWLQTAGLLRHSIAPPSLSAASFSQIGESLFGEEFFTERVVVDAKISPHPREVMEMGGSSRSEVSLWSRFLLWLWPSSGWRPAWGVAALGCALLGVVGSGVLRMETTVGPRSSQHLSLRSAQEPWARGENPFAVTRNASERLGHVLRFYREQRHDQWLDDLGSSYDR